MSEQIMTLDNIVHIAADVKYEQALQLSDENAEKPSHIMDAGDLFLELHEESDQRGDLDKVIRAYETVVRLTPDGHECHAELHGQLGLALHYRFEYSRDMWDIENAIFTFERSIMLTPDHTDKPGCLNNLGNTFLCRFLHSGDLVDIDKAINANKRAVQLTADGHADKPCCLRNLGDYFACRFEHSGDLVDIDQAIAATERALCLTPAGHADQPDYLSQLGRTFLCRFEKSGNLVDLDKAIASSE